MPQHLSNACTIRYDAAQFCLLITSNLAFGDWGQILQGEWMTAPLLDRPTHPCEILEMNGESFRFKESMKEKRLSGG
jgi:DNA replication protein DnaC